MGGETIPHGRIEYNEGSRHTQANNNGNNVHTAVVVAYDPTEDTEEDVMSSYEKKQHEKINCCHNKTLLMKTIASGQLLSLMLCGTGTAATALGTTYHIRAPCFNAFLMYIILFMTFGIYALTRKDFFKMFRKNWWKYLIVSVFDVEANYLLTKAYAYTTLTSVQLCDSFTIPTVMVISFIFLRIRYKVIHYIGVAICLTGAIVLVFSDGGDKESNAKNEVLGDVIALCAAILYGTSNVGQEFLVKKYSSRMYLGMVGIYGVMISGMQVAIFERNIIDNITWSWKIVLLFSGFAVAQYIYYTVMPEVMKLSSATVVNLSLLTSDLYTLIVGLCVFSYKFSFLYFAAFAGIFTGLIIYNIKSTPTAPPRKKKKTKTNGYIEFKNKKNDNFETTISQIRSPLIKGNFTKYTVL